jgi:hypothetical protein
MRRFVLPLLAIATASAAAPASAQSGMIRDVLGNLVGGQTRGGLGLDQLLGALGGRGALRSSPYDQQQRYGYDSYGRQGSYGRRAGYRHRQHNHSEYADAYRSENRSYRHHHEERRERGDEGDED